MKTDNELIAEFMGGYNYDPDTRVLGLNIPHMDDQWFDIKEIQYHTSWDWLMPVVEKIESLGYDTDICGNNCMISEGTPQGDGGKYFRAMIDVDKYPKIVSVYEAVVEFIHWHNSQKQ